MASADLHDTVAARLRGDGQRYTGNRRALVDALDAADRPLTIPELLDRDRRLAQSSAYRNLAVLDAAGVVRRIVTSDEFARYELAEDLTEHHHHLICSACGTIVDFTVPAQLETSLDRVAQRVVTDTGFTVEHHRLDLVGVCGDCTGQA
jgi:Fe2+ or Zn2+ uptake regulation protein